MHWCMICVTGPVFHYSNKFTYTLAIVAERSRAQHYYDGFRKLFGVDDPSSNHGKGGEKNIHYIVCVYFLLL